MQLMGLDKLYIIFYKSGVIDLLVVLPPSHQHG